MKGLGEFDGNSITAGVGVPAGGIDTYQDWGEFAKAVSTSSYNTDHASLTGMSALRLESLETTAKAVVAKQDSAKVYKDLDRMPVTSTLHEWTNQISLGGQFDGLYNSETGAINSDVGDYQRLTMRIKYMATQAQISHVASVQGIMGAGLKARENKNAITRLIIGANRGVYHGDEAINPNAVNGIRAQLKTFDGGSHIVNCQDEGVTDANGLAQLLFRLKTDSQQESVFGNIDRLYLDGYTQNDLDLTLFPQYRVNLGANNSDLMIGAPVSGIRTSSGNIETHQDMWINNPNTAIPAYAKKAVLPDNAPGAPTVTLTAVASSVGSKFTAVRAGVYYIVVASENANGVQGIPSAMQSVAIAAGGSVDIGITANVDGRASGQAIYVSTQSPATTPGFKDVRLMDKVPSPAAGASTTVNWNARKIPGASSLYALTFDAESIRLAQLLPITQFPLYATNAAVIPWAVLMYWALQLGIPQHHYVIEGYQPVNGYQAFKKV